MGLEAARDASNLASREEADVVELYKAESKDPRGA